MKRREMQYFSDERVCFCALPLISAGKLLDGLDDALGADAKLLEEDEGRSGARDLADAHFAEDDVLLLGNHVKNSVADSALRVVIFDSDDLAAALLGVGQNGLLVDGLDCKRIHQANVDSLSASLAAASTAWSMVMPAAMTRTAS